MNRVIIRDANMSLSVNEFAEKFSKYTVISFINFFFGYDQVELNPLNQDMTAFIIPLGLFKMTTLF
jgi:hypothetical protein